MLVDASEEVRKFCRKLWVCMHVHIRGRSCVLRTRICTGEPEPVGRHVASVDSQPSLSAVEQDVLKDQEKDVVKGVGESNEESGEEDLGAEEGEREDGGGTGSNVYNASAHFHSFSVMAFYYA